MSAAPTRTASSFEATALGLLALVPFGTYARRLAEKPIARFAMDGDYAGLELATRYVFTGRTLLGPYSRFHFNHPGPAYFFFVAPIHRLCGGTMTGLFAGALFLNAAAAFTIVFALGVLTTRAHATTAAIVVLAWIVAFGDLATLPWNPLVVVLPLFAFLVLAGLLALGHSVAAPIAVLFAALVTQTHLSTVPTVVSVSVAASIAFAVQRKKSFGPHDRMWIAVSAGVFLLSVLPPLFEQATASEGNLTKLSRFFVDRIEPPKRLADCWIAWRDATSWLPARLSEHTVAAEGAEPTPMGSYSPPPSRTMVPMLAFLLAIVTGAVVAWKRRDRVSIVLQSIGLLAALSSFVALRGVVGPIYCYLVFWTTAATSMVWLGALAPISSWIPRQIGSAIVVAMALFATATQNAWLTKNSVTANAENPREDVRTIYAALRSYMRQHDATPVFHPDASWNTTLELMNELARDGLEGRVEERERWILGRQFKTPTGAKNPFHVYTATWYQKLETAPCLELVKKDGDTALYVSPVEVTRCP